MSEPSAPDALAHLGDEPMELDPQPDPHVPTSWSSPPSDLREAIRRRAEEIYHRNGKLPGRDAQDWAQAEAEILREFSAATRRSAIVVNLDGVQYVGEYSPASSQHYTPGEFSPGSPIPVRIEGQKMFVTRPNGQELETTIVQKIG